MARKWNGRHIHAAVFYAEADHIQYRCIVYVHGLCIVYIKESNKQFARTSTRTHKHTNREMYVLKVCAYNTNYDSAFDAQMSFLMGCSRAYIVISEIYFATCRTVGCLHRAFHIQYIHRNDLKLSSNLRGERNG